jgi:hypothetical protein
MPRVGLPKKSGRVQGDAGRSGGAGANRATARRWTTAPYGAPLVMGRREGTGGVRNTAGHRERAFLAKGLRRRRGGHDAGPLI